MISSSVRTGRPIPSARRYLGAIVLTVVLGSLVAILLVGGALSSILADAEADVDQHLESSVLDELLRSARQQGESLSIEFDHARDDAEQIRDETLRILENPEPVDPSEAERYLLTPEGSYITRVVDDGAAMYYSAINEIGPAQKEKALQFSRLDPLLRYITDANPLVAQSYVNTYDTMLRLYPNFSVADAFPPDTDVRDFNFFYLADAKHNPDRTTLWTPVYVDPVGQGWITSVISPVYRGDTLEAVAALDIRVQQLVDQILDEEQLFGGYSVLVDDGGVIIAMPPEMEEVLQLDEVTNVDYSKYIYSDTFKSDDFNINLRDDTVELAEALTAPTGVQRLSVGNSESFVAWDTIGDTGWRVVTITPTAGVADIYEPGDRTSDATRYAFAIMVGALMVVVTGIFVWLYSSSRRLTNQFIAIDRATARIAEGDFHPTLPAAPIAEMESTGSKILDMGSRLDRAQAELRERAEQLRANEQRYRAIFANVAEAVLTVSADGVIVDANDAAVSLFSGNLEGKSARAALHTDSWSVPGRHVVELAAPAGAPRVLEFNVIATATPDDPDELGYTVSVRDLTSEIESARLLEDAREDAERTARLKDSLLSSMSHEIRTPMNGVIGILSLMADGDLPPTARQQLDVARRSAEDLLVLLNDVLDLAKLDAEQVTVSPRSVRLADLVHGVVQLHEPLAAEQDDVVLVDIERGVPDWIVIDPTRVRQVLMNLLNNALKFTREGSVTLRLHQTAIKEDGTFDLRCEVADTGTGIAAEAQSLLFQPFTQVDPLDARKYPGTGLGLAIVKRLVELMGGQVGLHSAVGRGSVFWFTVPASPGEPVVDEVVPAPVAANDSLHVLVAEDNEVNRMVLVRMLERLGHTSVEAVNGRQAIEIAQTDTFDVVLMDVQMPVASGIDATRAIRALGGRHAHVPILAVSANVLPEQQAQYLRSGMTAALAKPITLEQLGAALRRWVPRSTADAVPASTAPDRETPRPSSAPPATPEAESDIALLDEAAIRELRTTLGDAGSSKMRQLFPTSLAQRRTEMATALQNGDHDAARKAAHSIKGMAGSMGARALQHLAEQMQHADDVTFDGLVAAFERLADQTLVAFDAAWPG